ncbi:MAG: zinc ribbon domain-containing protein [Saprospiraceae bacterium]|nr:zinc ribbon domain-containing protein [Saprospiraceae bacterium]
MEKAYKNCQSCGLPMRRDELNGGTNADGTTSLQYCSLCYQDGRFTHPHMTMEEMKAWVKQRLQSFGFPGFIAGIFTRCIPKLQRWK